MIRGGEWIPSAIVNGCAGLLIICTLWTLDWHWLLPAAVLFWPGQWYLQIIAQRDPQYFEIHRRARQWPDVLEPHGKV